MNAMNLDEEAPPGGDGCLDSAAAEIVEPQALNLGSFDELLDQIPGMDAPTLCLDPNMNDLMESCEGRTVLISTLRAFLDQQNSRGFSFDLSGGAGSAVGRKHSSGAHKHRAKVARDPRAPQARKPRAKAPKPDESPGKNDEPPGKRSRSQAEEPETPVKKSRAQKGGDGETQRKKPLGRPRKQAETPGDGDQNPPKPKPRVRRKKNEAGDESQQEKSPRKRRKKDVPAKKSQSPSSSQSSDVTAVNQSQNPVNLPSYPVSGAPLQIPVRGYPVIFPQNPVQQIPVNSPVNVSSQQMPVNQSPVPQFHPSPVVNSVNPAVNPVPSPVNGSVSQQNPVKLMNTPGLVGVSQASVDSSSSSSKPPAKKRGRKPKVSPEEMIREKFEKLTLDECGSLVVYKGAGALIPSSKKVKKVRAKVPIDDETQRMWVMLMNYEEEDAKTEFNWKAEREAMLQKIKRFIAVMHLVQGNRRFSKWKGSVVDSVVGVFLTQNVSDHLSSSAFINLAARFPPKEEPPPKPKPAPKPAREFDLNTPAEPEAPAYRVEEADDDPIAAEEGEASGAETCDKRAGVRRSLFPDDNYKVGMKQRTEDEDEVINPEDVAEEGGVSGEMVHEAEAEELATASERKFTEKMFDMYREAIDREAVAQAAAAVAKGKQKMSSLSGIARANLEHTVSSGKSHYDWDRIKNKVKSDKKVEPAMDAVDWNAVLAADVKAVAETIRERGMNNVLAGRIKALLDKIYEVHGSIDLEWLRHVSPRDAKDFLLTIRGLGIKSVECIRLLCLEQVAFPVDVNVGRICVRLGWVPIEPLPEHIQLHLLDLYPVQESIQKYLWPRLCKLDQETLYELHYQLITFGKVFCTKSKPNCNACPMRKECKYFASAYSSAKLPLPAPPPPGSETTPELPALSSSSSSSPSPCEPIVEMPPEEEEEQPVKNESEACCEDSSSCSACGPKKSPGCLSECSGCPSSSGCSKSFPDEEEAQDMEDCGWFRVDLTEVDLRKVAAVDDEEAVEDGFASASRELMLLPEGYSHLPQPKLKDIHRLRTVHYVYELPDKHPVVRDLLGARQDGDPCYYLFVVWQPVEEELLELVNEQQKNSEYIKGSLLIPCRTAVRGKFPLNGTYFQVNEVFADHHSSYHPVDVKRSSLWNLRRRFVNFGSSVTAIFKGLTTEEIQAFFWRGYVCVRGFDRQERRPKPLASWLHSTAVNLRREKQRKEQEEEQKKKH